MGLCLRCSKRILYECVYQGFICLELLASSNSGFVIKLVGRHLELKYSEVLATTKGGSSTRITGAVGIVREFHKLQSSVRFSTGVFSRVAMINR